MAVRPSPLRTGPAPGVAEHLNQQVGTAVDDRWSPVEPRQAVDHPKNLDYATHPPQIAQLGAQHRENLQTVQPGRRPSWRQFTPPQCPANWPHSLFYARGGAN